LIDKGQLRDLITRILKDIQAHSDAAVELLMMTAAVESNLGSYLKQIKGPALGIFQMEPATERDIWKNYIAYNSGMSGYALKFKSMSASSGVDLEWNLAYQIIMARYHYRRVPKALPDVKDVEGMAKYWKDYYNTHLGKGTVAKAVSAYRKLCI